jgi:hypothetical protein
MPRRAPLTVEQILAWADAHHERTGAWPTRSSGPVAGAPSETWGNLHQALYHGLRGLPGAETLTRLLQRRRGVRNPACLPQLREVRIVRWAKEHRKRTGRWPTASSGPIASAPEETWRGVAQALVRGQRGLTGGDTLQGLLERRAGAAPRKGSTPLCVEQILAWADAHRERTGHWPMERSGPVPEAPQETWRAVCEALRVGLRGLEAGGSLPRLLAEHRDAPPRRQPKPLIERQIIAWARAHQGRTGRWPSAASGPVADAPQETWRALDTALREGFRGLPGGSSLSRLRRY